ATPVATGDITAAAGLAAMKSVETACDLCLKGDADAMVTAPISKEAIHLAGYDFPGHTEFLAEKTKAVGFVMMLVSGDLRVALQTIHMPISQVASQITQERVLVNLRMISDALETDLGIAKPRIAVLGLNPHAGEGGVIGSEEREIIQPAIERARQDGIHAEGPFPADSFFGRRTDKTFDAVLAMYHDQGLAPFKALAMGAGVNVTCGLPIVRTSPDHGTAFGIAGKGIASHSSMVEAIKLAAGIATRRRSR
ncbi:MAG: 4-hydroxythreonine-4-phosphate dehydrogenase PdxA, partial [Rubricoccaceae bacterium]|nr:4-hydroxythreonine-4-phosphate dehydrogenase PdxA [Rubricoccaceae bacterium]